MLGREELIEQLTANCQCDEDREAITNLKDETLQGLFNAKKKDEEDDEEELDEDGMEENSAQKQGKKAMTTNTDRQPTVNEWFASAPTEIQSAVRNAMRIEQQAKVGIVKQLTSNAERQKKLMNLSLEDLEERLADSKAFAANHRVADRFPSFQSLPNFTGAAAPDLGSTQVDNQKDLDDILPLPTVNYGEWQKESNRKAN